MKNETQMNATTMIHDLVRQGRATPDDAAVLMEMRRDYVARQKRADRGIWLTIFATIGVFLLALIGVKRNG